METIGLICLMNLKGIGRRTAWMAASESTFTGADPAEILDWLVEKAKTSKRIPIPTLVEVQEAWDSATHDYQANIKDGIKVIGARSPEYPDRLRRIADPPAVLYVKGDPSALKSEIMIAVIGTREPSDFGMESGRRISAFLACSGATIVSGLARGCDTTGHKGCLDAGGKTIAVLAHGLDSVHPRENKRLADEIVESGGCVISEYATGTKPARNFFVERDRLQSGLSDGVIVIETGTSGGTLHTARFCLEQKRKLAAVKHTEKWSQHDKAQGNQMLIREGKATPLGNKEDVNQFLQSLQSQSLENEHCDHWMDTGPSADKQLTLL